LAQRDPHLKDQKITGFGPFFYFSATFSAVVGAMNWPANEK